MSCVYLYKLQLILYALQSLFRFVMRPLLRAEESQDYNKDKSTLTDFYVRKCAFVLVWRLFARSRSPPCLICIIQKQIRIRRLQMFTKNNGSDEHDIWDNICTDTRKRFCKNKQFFIPILFN